MQQHSWHQGRLGGGGRKREQQRRSRAAAQARSNGVHRADLRRSRKVAPVTAAPRRLLVAKILSGHPERLDHDKRAWASCSQRSQEILTNFIIVCIYGFLGFFLL